VSVASRRVACRVDGDVAIPIPHRPGRADFPHPVLHERDSLAEARPGAILVDRPLDDTSRDSSVEEGWPPRRLGYPLSFVDGSWGTGSPPGFQANGPLLMTPPSPPPGPAEHGSPPSQVILRRYDFPPAHPVPLFCSVAGPTRSSLCSCSPRRSGDAWRALPRPGTLVQPAFLFSGFAPVDASGISQVPWRSVPCLCPAPGPRPSRRDLALWRSRRRRPRAWHAEGLSGSKISGLPHMASASAVYAS
jgi:hypothetical protein